jgi:hypothetical protein
MFQAYVQNVSIVSNACFKCFRLDRGIEHHIWILYTHTSLVVVVEVFSRARAGNSELPVFNISVLSSVISYGLCLQIHIFIRDCNIYIHLTLAALLIIRIFKIKNKEITKSKKKTSRDTNTT